ncbi:MULTISPECIES: hypothetical protein [Ralstonia]|jgi:hypothetical protein|uniref:Uncharacterized protein n=2 Tax=Ralstonia pickettii TaxID=329 RepID=R0CN79_RALPI|nr:MULTISPECIES: hypothetical protein [Ralstonia]ENZ77940.1 hypothetical protein OR214_02216 [Ralstonia pickettii OR214]MCM3581965.1 hypothetical protein [Ralstonia pickettii]
MVNNSDANTARSWASSPGAILLWLLVLGLVIWGIADRLSALSEWVSSDKIRDREEALLTGKAVDESTVVLTTLNDATGIRQVYYKFGHSEYAKALRDAGIGCRFYTPGGTPYSFAQYKTTDPIPADKVPAGVWVKGTCDIDQIGGVDLARIQK